MLFHIDMNSYFASVEQQFDPKLRGKPVGVCAYLSKNGCVIASSSEAKTFGVKTGMRVREALKLCPKLHLVENDPKKYRATTQKIFTILKDYSDEFEPYSIDEAFLNIPYVHNEREGFDLGQEWNKRIKQEVGEYLRSSVGFAQNHFYAKVFSDNGPKDSCFHVPYPQLDIFLSKLELEDIWGIGKKTAEKLRTLKLFTPLDVKRSNPDPLIEVLGKYGYDLWQNLNHVAHSPRSCFGEAGNTNHETKNTSSHSQNNNESSYYALHDPRHVTSDYPKSIGHSYCLPLKTYNLDTYKKVLYKLCERTCVRLREMNKVALGVSFAFPQQTRGDLNPDATSHASFKVTTPVADALDLYRSLLPHLESLPQERIKMIAVSLFNFSSKEHKQLSLFDPSVQIKKDSLLESFDSINRKWGPFTVARGAMFKTKQYAHERIGFRKL